MGFSFDTLKNANEAVCRANNIIRELSEGSEQ